MYMNTMELNGSDPKANWPLMALTYFYFVAGFDTQNLSRTLACKLST